MSRSNTRKPCSSAATADVDPAHVRQQLVQRAAEIERQQVDEAIAELAQGGELTATQREVVRRFADRLVAELIAGPVSALDRASPGDAETARTVAWLFDLDSTEQD